VLFALLAVILLQVGVGFWAARRVASDDDLLVAGRRLGPWLATASIFATWFGAESCIGAAGDAYESGLHALTVEPFAYGLCLVLMGLLFAARMHRLKLTTVADFFAIRFGAGPERLAAVLLLPSSLFWAAAQLRAFGHIVATNSDGMLTAAAATWIAAGVAIAYTASGGLLADVYTDVVQGALLLVGLAVLGAAVWSNLATGTAAVAATPPAGGAAAAGPEPSSLLAVLEGWAIPLCGSIVAQEALSRSLGARTPTIARNAAICGGAIYLVAGLVPLTIGLVGPQLAPGLEDPEAILPHLSSTLLSPVLNFVFAIALVSAILSTVDSCLLVVAAIATRNLLPAAATSSARLRSARIGVGAGGAVALALALSGWNVKELVEQASGFGSAGVFVLVLFGTYTRVGGAVAAVLSLLAGLGTWAVGSYTTLVEIEHPYLASLGAALSGFAIGAVVDRARRADRA
jgi:Na+/proline symporter